MTFDETTPVLVAGASGTIGSTVVDQLVAGGYTVLAVTRRGGCAKSRGAVEDFACDLLSRDGRTALICRLRQLTSGLGGLVCCLPTPRDLDGGMKAGRCAIQLVEDSLPFLTKNEGGVVMLSSTAAQRPIVTGDSRFYAAAKGMVEGYVRASAEMRPVRVNAVAPGLVEGPHRPGGVHDRIDARVQIPMGRLVGPEEVAKAVIYLLEAKSVFCQVMTVDGGMSACIPLSKKGK